MAVKNILPFPRARDCHAARQDNVQLCLQAVRTSRSFCSPIPYLDSFSNSRPSVKVNRERFDDSTGNLAAHVKICNPKEMEMESITAFANGSTYSGPRMRYLLAIWCARRHRPFKIVEDPELVEIFGMLYSRAEIPSRVMISRDINEIFNLAKTNVAQSLQVRDMLCSFCLFLSYFKAYPGKLHLAVDGWTSPNVFSFLGVTVHRCVDGKIQEFILDFIK